MEAYTFLALFIFAAASKTVANGREMKCLNEPVNWTKTHQDHLTKCLKDHQIEDPENNGQKKISGCFYACKFEDMITDGKADHKKMETYVNTIFPEAARSELIKAFTDCSSQATEKLSFDDDCKSYVTLGKCIYSSVGKICKM